MKKFISNKYTLYTLGIFLFIVLWLLISTIVGEKTLILPDPVSTFSYSLNILKSSYIYKCILFSTLRMIVGYAIAFVLGAIFGTIAGIYESFYNLLKPIIEILKAIPTATIVFLFLVAVGSRFTPAAIVVLISFPILYEAFAAGIRDIDKSVFNASRIDTRNAFQRLFKIRYPLALPYIIVGINSSFALSFKIEIMAEIIAGDTKNGIGSAILAAQKNNPTDLIPIFGYSLIALVFMLIITLISYLVSMSFDKKYGKR